MVGVFSRRKFIAALAALPVVVSAPLMRRKEEIYVRTWSLSSPYYDIAKGDLYLWAPAHGWAEGDKIRFINAPVSTITGWDRA